MLVSSPWDEKKGEHIMKRYIVLSLAIGLVLALATAAIAGILPGTGIQDTSHDLSATGPKPTYGNGETRICIFCHTPHFAAQATLDAAKGIGTSVTYYPLWNHDVTQIATYATYTNASANDTPNDLAHQLNADLSAGPGGVSRLCLSCHDGSVAVNAYGNLGGGANPTKGAGGNMINASYMIGGTAHNDLSNHHPIGFDYNAAMASDDELQDPVNAFINSSRGVTVDSVLWNGKVECTSCHDVHNTKNDGYKFLWVDDNHQSDLCRSCHLK
jgi:predicted CXXCH cytochrome family protein